MASNTTEYNRAYHARRLEQRRAAQARYRSTERGRRQRRSSELLRKYGMDADGYDEMLATQSGGCAICGSGPSCERGGVLHVDHDHATGKVRGLLCLSCNTLLGHAEDNIETLKKAIEYLETK